MTLPDPDLLAALRDLGASEWKSKIEAQIAQLDQPDTPDTAVKLGFIKKCLDDLRLEKRKEIVSKYLSGYDFDNSLEPWILDLFRCDPNLPCINFGDGTTFFHWMLTKQMNDLFRETFEIAHQQAKGCSEFGVHLKSTLQGKDVGGCTVLDRVALIRGQEAVQIMGKLLDFDSALVLEMGGYPLHRAASNRNMELVKLLCTREPNIVTVTDSLGKSAVNSEMSLVTADTSEPGQGLPMKYRDKEIQEYLRRRIASLDISQNNNIRDLLFDNQEQETEIGMDLGAFNNPGHDFSVFLEDLSLDWKNLQNAQKRGRAVPQSRLPVEYTSTLAYVKFPELSPSQTESNARREVENVLRWLKDVKKVVEIVRLYVPDCLTDPHCDTVIERCLGYFHDSSASYDPADSIEGKSIKVLDWRKLDLSADILLDRARGVERLSLYSSGNWGVIDHWFGENGLQKLPRLHQLHIFIVMSRQLERKRAQDLKRRIKDSYEEIFNGRGWDLNNIKVINPFSKPLKGPPKPQLKSVTNIVPYLVTKLEPLLEWYETYCRQNPSTAKATKVAIIDNGVDSSPLGGIVMGKSFVRKNGLESPWYIPSDPHGTQMAQLVRSLDPMCELYIAKVCDSRSDIQVYNVIEALKWARSNQVDIISMSFALRLYGQPKRDLENEIEQRPTGTSSTPSRESAWRDIVMFGSTGDMGRNKAPNWPADFANVISIAACNREGKEWTYTEDADYWIEGQDVGTDRLNYLLSPEVISGSSISTALAAGLASLLLCCSKITHNEPEDAQSVTPFIRGCFNFFKGYDPHYLRPWIAFGIPADDKKQERWDEIEGIDHVKLLFDRLQTAPQQH